MMKTLSANSLDVPSFQALRRIRKKLSESSKSLRHEPLDGCSSAGTPVLPDNPGASDVVSLLVLPDVCSLGVSTSSDPAAHPDGLTTIVEFPADPDGFFTWINTA